MPKIPTLWLAEAKTSQIQIQLGQLSVLANLSQNLTWKKFFWGLGAAQCKDPDSIPSANK